MKKDRVPPGWTQVKSDPKPGDVIVWSAYVRVKNVNSDTFWTNPAEGHVGIVVEVNGKDVDPDAPYADAVSWAVANGVTEGTSKTKFSPVKVCSRGEIVTFLYRTFK